MRGRAGQGREGVGAGRGSPVGERGEGVRAGGHVRWSAWCWPVLRSTWQCSRLCAHSGSQPAATIEQVVCCWCTCGVANSTAGGQEGVGSGGTSACSAHEAGANSGSCDATVCLVCKVKLQAWCSVVPASNAAVVEAPVLA